MKLNKEDLENLIFEYSSSTTEDKVEISFNDVSNLARDILEKIDGRYTQEDYTDSFLWQINSYGCDVCIKSFKEYKFQYYFLNFFLLLPVYSSLSLLI